MMNKNTTYDELAKRVDPIKTKSWKKFKMVIKKISDTSKFIVTQDFNGINGNKLWCDNDRKTEKSCD